MSSHTSAIEAAKEVIAEAIEPNALAVDEDGRFPRAAMDGLGHAGLLGLISSPDVGGLGADLQTACEVVQLVAAACASSGMVLCMHYTATAVVEKYGPTEIRKHIAEGQHLTTIAFSEFGTRSHFWAPVGTATETAQGIRLDATKSWVTSAGEADSYVWSSKPITGDDMSTLWLVPADTPGLSIPSRFNGLGLRGNASSPVTAEEVLVNRDNMIGEDGQGFSIMMDIPMPHFQVFSSSAYLGIMEAATLKTAAHISQTQLSDLSQSLAELPTIRAYLARMRMKTDMVRTLLSDTVTALQSGREDTMLRLFEIKAAAGELAREVCETAMRVCGGAAYRKELGIERHFRDAQAATVMAPTTDMLYDFIGRALCGMPLL